MIRHNITILSQMSFFLEFFNVFFYTFIVVKQWDFFPTIYAPENGSLLHLDFKADVSTDFSMFFGSFSLVLWMRSWILIFVLFLTSLKTTLEQNPYFHSCYGFPSEKFKGKVQIQCWLVKLFMFKNQKLSATTVVFLFLIQISTLILWDANENCMPVYYNRFLCNENYSLMSVT